MRRRDRSSGRSAVGYSLTYATLPIPGTDLRRLTLATTPVKAVPPGVFIAAMGPGPLPHDVRDRRGLMNAITSDPGQPMMLQQWSWPRSPSRAGRSRAASRTCRMCPGSPQRCRWTPCALRFAPVRSPPFRHAMSWACSALVSGRGARGRHRLGSQPVRPRLRPQIAAACGDSYSAHPAQSPSCHPLCSMPSKLRRVWAI